MVRRKSMREFAWPMTLRTETSMIGFSSVVFSSQEAIEKAVALAPHWRTSFFAWPCAETSCHRL